MGRAFSSLSASLTGGGVIFMNAFPPSSSSPTHEKGRMTEEAVFFSISHAIVTSKMMTFASHASVVLCAFLGCRASIKFPNLCPFVGSCGVRSIASGPPPPLPLSPHKSDWDLYPPPLPLSLPTTQGGLIPAGGGKARSPPEYFQTFFLSWG